MSQPNQPHNPNGAFDPDQYKNDILNAVQQQLNILAQNFAPPAQAQPVSEQDELLQAMMMLSQRQEQMMREIQNNSHQSSQ